MADIKVKGKKFVRYSLNFTSKPDKRLPIIMGDVIHNVRSALDHLMVAMVPKKFGKPSFSIFTTRPYGDNGEPFDNEAGNRWAKLKAALPGEAFAQFEILQPFQPAPDDVIALCQAHGINPSDIHALAQLNWLDNADKHRELIDITQGLTDPTVTVTSPNGDVVRTYPMEGDVIDGQ